MWRYLKSLAVLALRIVMKGKPRRVVAAPEDISFGRILVIRPHDMLGDFILATPVFRALRAHLPHAHIGVVVREDFAEVMQNSPYIDDLLVFYKKSHRWTLARMVRLWRQLRKGWDFAIILNTVSHSVTSDTLALLAKSATILGPAHPPFAEGKVGSLYDIISEYVPGDHHQSQRNLHILRAIGIESTDLAESITITQKEREAAFVSLAKQSFRTHRPTVGIHLGARKIENRWAPEQFAALADVLHGEGIQVVVFWGPREADLAEAFRSHVSFTPVMMPPSTLRALAASFQYCTVAVCNDTGVMHLCAAAGVPLVGLFGPTDPSFWKPAGEGIIAVRGANGAMDALSIREVLAAVENLLHGISPETR